MTKIGQKRTFGPLCKTSHAMDHCKIMAQLYYKKPRELCILSTFLLYSALLYFGNVTLLGKEL